MKIILAYVAMVLCLSASHRAFSQDESPLVVLVPPIVYQDFYAYIDGKNIEAINYFGGAGSRRDVVEVILMHQALLLGGFHDGIELRPINSYKRILHRLGEGHALMSANSVWLEDIDDQSGRFLVSDALIHNGEFEVGLYARPDNKAALSLKSTADLTPLSAVSSRNWITDWRTLKNLPLHSLYDVPLWYSMVKMVVAKRADILLAPFQSNANMELRVKGEVLMPVPGVKLSLDGSRHWAVSATHPKGELAHKALQLGLAKMRKQGRIVRAYKESGTFHHKVANWTVLNPALQLNSKMAPKVNISQNVYQNK